ncbi:hypothetical protein VSR01_16170 [Actinacidiphila sp. DG2A-62]|uniref:hypothetical protein n=1 Tax=Actinacidiphila sp. DG2A-62 TaxID=3108821 RepID=UPI002DBB97B6|nr:hypothetical protein [Actinacidiphila sp. DG2A-62]MEC3994981.1 hypothetical protein [Actinacidiphila sp. DG2A-62]
MPGRQQSSAEYTVAMSTCRTRAACVKSSHDGGQPSSLIVGEYKGHALYDGRALEAFDDREALDAAAHAGQLYSKNAAAYLRIRPADLDHLLRAGLLEEKHRVRAWNQPKRAYPAVPLYRRGDLDELLARTDIDWAEAQATPKGRPSPFAKLPDAAASA